MEQLAVVIPTRNRPKKLRKCLQALEAARAAMSFNIYVCDSSTEQSLKNEVEAVCATYDFVRLSFHSGTNVAMARNACARAADATLLVNVDDDVYVYPDSIAELLRVYNATSGDRLVVGSVAWGDTWSDPVKMRFMGYGRAIRKNEKADFFIGAFFLYPKATALAKPWNERIQVADDQFMGALLRSAGVEICFAANARAQHDEEHNSYGINHLDSHYYANMFDALVANPSYIKAAGYEVFGFFYGLKLALTSAVGVKIFLMKWIQGHRALIRDWKYLSDLVGSPLH